MYLLEGVFMLWLAKRFCKGRIHKWRSFGILKAALVRKLGKVGWGRRKQIRFLWMSYVTLSHRPLSLNSLKLFLRPEKWPQLGRSLHKLKSRKKLMVTAAIRERQYIKWVFYGGHSRIMSATVSGFWIHPVSIFTTEITQPPIFWSDFGHPPYPHCRSFI